MTNILMESDRILEHHFTWEGHRPREDREVFQMAAKDLVTRLNNMANISEFDASTGSDVQRSLSANYQEIGPLLGIGATFSDDERETSRLRATQRGLIISVKAIKFKPGTFYNKSKQDALTRKRESIAGGTLLFEFVVYAPDNYVLTRRILPGPFYYIQQQSSSRFLDAWEDNHNGHDYSATTRPKQNNKSQRWYLKKVSNNLYTIQQQSSNRFLDAWEDDHNDHDYSATTRFEQNNKSQQWLLKEVGDNLYTIQQQSSGRFLDAWEDNHNGHDYSVTTRPIQNNKSQQWLLIKTE